MSILGQMLLAVKTKTKQRNHCSFAEKVSRMGANDGDDAAELNCIA